MRIGDNNVVFIIVLNKSTEKLHIISSTQTAHISSKVQLP